MAKSTKTGSNGHYKSANGSQNGTHRIFDDVLALAGTLARGRKDLGAEKLHSLASSTREFAASMTDLPYLRLQVTSAAESLEGLSEYVMHTEIEQMAGDAGTFARRHPLTTLAVTVAAGIAAGRFMRKQPVSTAGSRRGRGSQRSAAPSARKRVAQARRSPKVKVQAHA